MDIGYRNTIMYIAALDICTDELCRMAAWQFGHPTDRVMADVRLKRMQNGMIRDDDQFGVGA